MPSKRGCNSLSHGLFCFVMLSMLREFSSAFLNTKQTLPRTPKIIDRWRLSSSESESSSSAEGNDTVVTREIFLRDMLEDPKVKRKRKGSGYRVLDNRDSLPYQVQISTPDPYTHPEIKRRNAKKVRKRPDAVEEQIASSLFTSQNESKDNTETLLGEFSLDKLTTTGDLIEIGNVTYKVIKHRCQYKYAGGKRFVMVRKILHVTEIGRLQTEEYLKRQLKLSGDESQPVLE